MVSQLGFQDLIFKKVKPIVGELEFSKWNDSPGPSAEFAIRDFLNQVILKERKDYLKVFVAPCCRKEKKKNIEAGTHLSLFFILIVFVTGEKATSIALSILEKILELDVEKLDLDSSLVNDCSDLNFRLQPGGFKASKNFPFNGTGFQIHNTNGLELAHFVRLTKKNEPENEKRYLFGIGLERLFMHMHSELDIWRVPPFCQILEKYESKIYSDLLRREYFFNSVQLKNDKIFEKIIIRGFL